MSGEVLASGGDVAAVLAMEEGEVEVAEDGEGLRSVSSAGGGGVLSEDDVAQPVEAVFNSPVQTWPEPG